MCVVGKPAALGQGLSARYSDQTSPNSRPTLSSHRILFQDGEIIFIRLDRHDLSPGSERKACKNSNVSANVQPHVNASDFEAADGRMGGWMMHIW